MKILHTSDLHIGLKLNNRDLCEDQRFILNQMTERAAALEPDVFIIAGDIYDRAVPSAEAVEIFDEFIGKLVDSCPKCKVMLISGNHDSAQRINCYRNILQRENVYAVGLPPRDPEEHIEKVVVEDEYGKVNFYLLPFIKPSMVKKITGEDENGNNLSYEETIKKLIEREHIDTFERNVIVSHQFYLPVGKNADEVDRMDSEIQTVGNVDAVSAEVISCFDYAALGHIHKPMKVGSEVLRYVGTPLACSVSEAGQQKGMLLVNMQDKGNIEVENIPLKPLRKVMVIKGSYAEILEKACDDYVTVILDGKEELDVIDAQERIRMAFPYLLEIRRENMRHSDYKAGVDREKLMDPYELCMSFLGETDDEEKNIMQDIINKVLGSV